MRQDGRYWINSPYGQWSDLDESEVEGPLIFLFGKRQCSSANARETMRSEPLKRGLFVVRLTNRSSGTRPTSLCELLLRLQAQATRRRASPRAARFQRSTRRRPNFSATGSRGRSGLPPDSRRDRLRARQASAVVPQVSDRRRTKFRTVIRYIVGSMTVAIRSHATSRVPPHLKLRPLVLHGCVHLVKFASITSRTQGGTGTASNTHAGGLKSFEFQN